MNHNGVVSLPTNGSTTYVAGDIVGLTHNSDSVVCVPNDTAKTQNIAIGVVLHDLKADETDQPLAVQLFSAGGTAIIQSTAAGIEIGDKVGYPNNDKHVVKNGANRVGVALEKAGSSGGVIRVLLTSL